MQQFSKIVVYLFFYLWIFKYFLKLFRNLDINWNYSKQNEDILILAEYFYKTPKIFPLKNVNRRSPAFRQALTQMLKVFFKL